MSDLTDDEKHNLAVDMNDAFIKKWKVELWKDQYGALFEAIKYVLEVVLKDYDIVRKPSENVVPLLTKSNVESTK